MLYTFFQGANSIAGRTLSKTFKKVKPKCAGIPPSFYNFFQIVGIRTQQMGPEKERQS